MDSFTSFDDLLASLDSPISIVSIEHDSEKNLQDMPVDEERFGRSTTTTFCVIS
ncbi:hypothetical protein BDN70DRAFT_881210 [Pholiota conissans]|uniref:Pheromone n=1 Tax=Pholiota conissans TaxID=109636 RepID=A0A9P5YXR9_9AGAR|nr:hypothetical protein BDN70DRAFT_881210 [Pholiota conissans]